MPFTLPKCIEVPNAAFQILHAARVRVNGSGAHTLHTRAFTRRALQRLPKQALNMKSFGEISICAAYR
jgi:hypothetical protein